MNSIFSAKGGIKLKLKENILDNYYYGAASYPEVIDEETFISDIDHMKSIGMNVIRIGEFFWSKLEPKEDQYQISYLTHLLDILNEKQMNVILGIPTPTPPRWFTLNYPDSHFINNHGDLMEHGSRQHVCTNNPHYRKKAYQLTEKIAEVIDKYSNIIAIQLDNEYKCHVDTCFCQHCQEQWHQYLQSEYQTIDCLNDAWGTAIWSEEYSDFSEIPLPKATPFLHNTSLQNSFRKFHTDTINDFAKESTKIIRRYSDVVVTHNSALGFNLDNQELFSDLDIAGFDTYAGADNFPAYLMNIDLFRNIKGVDVTESLLLETSTAHAGHTENYVAPHPKGYLQTEVFTGFAGGLRVFSYWHFRGHASGVEQPHSSVLTAWGEPGVGYSDVVESGKIIEKIKPILATTKLIRSKIAILYSDESRRFFNIENGGKYQYRQLITDFYSFFVKKGYAVELVSDNMDLDIFETVFIPFKRHFDEALLKKTSVFVKNGGHVIVGPMTGDRTKELAFPTDNGLGILGKKLGLSGINQYWQTQSKDKPFHGYTTTFMVDNSWKALLLEGNMCLWAEKSVEKGKIVVAGAFDASYTSEDWKNLLVNSIKNEESNPYQNIHLTEGLKLYVRDNQEATYYFLANMTGEKKNYELLLDMVNFEDSAEFRVGSYMMNPYECLVFEVKK